MGYNSEGALQRAQAAGALTAANYNADVIRALLAIGGGHQILGADCSTSPNTGYGANSATQYTIVLPTPSNPGSNGSAYLGGDQFYVSDGNCLWLCSHSVVSGYANALNLQDKYLAMRPIDNTTPADYSALSYASMTIWRISRTLMPVQTSRTERWFFPLDHWSTTDFPIASFRLYDDIEVLSVQPCIQAALSADIIFRVTNGTTTVNTTLVAGATDPGPTEYTASNELTRTGAYQTIDILGVGASPATSPIGGWVVTVRFL